MVSHTRPSLGSRRRTGSENDSVIKLALVGKGADTIRWYKTLPIVQGIEHQRRCKRNKAL